MFPALDQIDWNRPWFQPLKSIAQSVLDAGASRDALNAAASAHGLSNDQALPLCFVPQAALPLGMAYETFIWNTGCVPTRDNLHDFFNALIWLAYPHIKARLNALQAAEIRRMQVDSASGRRGPLRDALTVFDENAAFILLRRSPRGAAFRDALTGHRWKDAFLAHRDAFGTDYDIQLFGHALLEKLVQPYKAITAHARLVEVEDEYFKASAALRQGMIDRHISTALGQQPCAMLQKTPLPIAGIPGWSEEQGEVFYDDEAVFRPKRLTS